MKALLVRSRTSTRTAVLVGIALGLAVLSVYVVAGLLFADWSVAEFLGFLTAELVGWLLLATIMTVALFAIPVVAAIRFDVYAPLVVLGLVVLGWFGIGITSGMLSAQTVFGLGYYAATLAPLYLVLYGVLGGVEYLVRTRRIAG